MHLRPRWSEEVSQNTHGFHDSSMLRSDMLRWVAEELWRRNLHSSESCRPRPLEAIKERHFLREAEALEIAMAGCAAKVEFAGYEQVLEEHRQIGGEATPRSSHVVSLTINIGSPACAERCLLEGSTSTKTW